MAGSNAKGTYYKRKSKQYLEAQGYTVSLAERLQTIHVKGRTIYIKKDTWGADGLAMKATEDIIFWQSKLGRSNILAAKKEFRKYPFPPTVRRWIIVWTARVKEPEIIPMEKAE